MSLPIFTSKFLLYYCLHYIFIKIIAYRITEVLIFHAVKLWWWSVPKFRVYLISRIYSNRENLMLAKYTFYISSRKPLKFGLHRCEKLEKAELRPLYPDGCYSRTTQQQMICCLKRNITVPEWDEVRTWNSWQRSSSETDETGNCDVFIIRCFWEKIAHSSTGFIFVIPILIDTFRDLQCVQNKSLPLWMLVMLQQKLLWITVHYSLLVLRHF